MKNPTYMNLRFYFATAFILIFSSLASAEDVTWTGAAGDNLWETGQNWDNGAGPAEADFVYMSSGTIEFTETAGTTPGLQGFRQSGGTLNISEGAVEAAQNAGQFSIFDGTVNQTNGFASINAVRIGAGANSNGSVTLSGGQFNIARGKNGVSLHLGGLSSGNGSLTISGGSFATRTTVQLGSGTSTGVGTFSVLGSQASIGIGTAGSGLDGKWFQSAGSSLVLRFDVGGTSPIFIKDQTGANATIARFESGSILDVDHLVGDGGGSWTVMEVENGEIDDQGLEFAPGVDTDVWSFAVDNSGANGKLIVTAIGDPVGFDLIVGNTRLQKMRYGMDYERLWYWTGGLNDAERELVAKWSAIDTRIDYIRVAMNSGYELVEGEYDLSAYTNKIIPMMQKMKEANPDIKFFASPRPLNEAYPNKKWEGENVRWQPYPIWVTGAPTPISGNFDFQWLKCAEYLERYLLLMNDYGFKISFMDLTNEWQSNDNNNAPRITQADARDITEYLKDSPALAAANVEVPLFIGPSAWNYSQGASWIRNLDTQRRRDAIDIAACHNTNRTGTAQQFADDVRDTLGPDTEIWNTEVHGWKSTSSENETTSFYYMLEKIRAGFSGLNGWLAIGTTNQGHAYILNPNGSPVRNVKYFIFKKLSETSNYGHALNIVEEPGALSHTAALIKGNLMTVWVINEGTGTVPIYISPAGRTISGTKIKRTHWIDQSIVEGFVSHEDVTASDTHLSNIPGESVCCFEILLEPEEYAYQVIQAEDEDERNGMQEEPSGDDDETANLGFISHDNWARYNDVAIAQDSAMRFRTARPAGREDGWIEVYLGASGESTANILAGTLVGKVAVPETGNWQTYETIEAALEHAAGNYDVVLRFVEVGNDSGGSLFNFNWFSVVSPAPVVVGVEMNVGEEAQRSAVESISIRFDGNVDFAAGAASVVQRSTATEATFEAVSSTINWKFMDGETVATIIFDSHVRNSDGALVDGNYQVTLTGSLVSQDGFAMSEDFVYGDVVTDGFYSYYGDLTGDRSVNVLDLLPFRQSYGSFSGASNFNYAVDFNASGSVNVIDLLQFRNRYGTSLPFEFGSSRSSGATLAPFNATPVKAAPVRIKSGSVRQFSK